MALLIVSSLVSTITMYVAQFAGSIQKGWLYCCLYENVRLMVVRILKFSVQIGKIFELSFKDHLLTRSTYSAHSDQHNNYHHHVTGSNISNPLLLVFVCLP